MAKKLDLSGMSDEARKELGHRLLTIFTRLDDVSVLSTSGARMAAGIRWAHERVGRLLDEVDPIKPGVKP